MTNIELFQSLRSMQDLSDLHYPAAKDWMWNYCLFLGKFSDSKGTNYDLGVLVSDWQGILAANVYSNEPVSYKSGELVGETSWNGKVMTRLEYYQLQIDSYQFFQYEHYVETIKRCKQLGLL